MEDSNRECFNEMLYQSPGKYYQLSFNTNTLYYGDNLDTDLKTIPPKYENAAIIPPDDPNRQYGCALCVNLFETQEELRNHGATAH